MTVAGLEGHKSLLDNHILQQQQLLQLLLQLLKIIQLPVQQQLQLQIR